MKLLLILLTLLSPSLCMAELPDAIQQEPSVESNIREMDADRDGMVTMAEVKHHLQKHYGNAYKKSLLEKLEARAEAKSCGSPFSRPTF